MKLRKCLALFLAVTLMVSALPQSGSTVSASEPTGIIEAEKPQEESETEVISTETKDAEISEVEESKSSNSSENDEALVTSTPSESEKNPEADTPTENGDLEAVKPAGSDETSEETNTANNNDVLETEKTNGNDDTLEAEKSNESDKSPEVVEPTENVEDSKIEDTDKNGETLKEKESTESNAAPEEEEQTEANAALDPAESEATEETDPSQIPSVMSLLPLTQVSGVTLVLNDYSEEQLKAVPLEVVLSKLKDRNGKPIEIPNDANIVWAYFKDANGNVLDDEYHMIGREETVDLSSYYWENYEMELIIGKGTQLDADSIRYSITVYINEINEKIDYELYTGNGTERKEIQNKEIRANESSLLADTGIPITEVSYYISPNDTSLYKEGDTCYLGLTSRINTDSKYDHIKVDVYPMKKFLEDYQNSVALSGAITSQILEQNMSDNGGYEGKFLVPDSSNPLSSDNIFCMVYTDTNTGSVIAYQGLIFIIRPQLIEDVTGDIFTYEDGQMKSVSNKDKSDSYSGGKGYWYIDYMDEPNAGIVGYSAGHSRYQLLEGYSSDLEYYYVMDYNDQIEKIVLGYYNTLEAALNANAEDVTAQVMPSDRNVIPYGYKTIYDDDVRFTIFFKNGTVLNYYVYVEETYTPNNEPIEENLWFRMIGAVGYNSYNIYRINNSSLDTYCANKFQTLLINDENVNLKKLIPIFECTQNAKVSVGTEQKSGESEQDFSQGPVVYTVTLGNNNPPNYTVTFVKKEAGPKLFVNGPEKREIFLTDYFENRHDILIANVGSEKLTGLKVEIQNANHVKLDDYWTVGGANNDTLAAFNSTYSWNMANLAKIRLLPDGDGMISGTLVISADGQEPVHIELTGYAGNPKIITESLSDGVKYVPYSYVVATNNMYEWNTVTFSAKGKLPEGLEMLNSGEIYGIPKETGEFPITIKAEFSRPEFRSAYAELVLTVQENTNDNVYNASDIGYEVKEHIGRETKSGTYDYVLQKKGDQLFVSNGVLNEFVDLWLNGEKLIEGEDYTKESGSTRITIREQTFENKANKDGSNTIAAEFRVDGDENNDLKRTAQNFRIDIRQGGKSGGGSKGNDDNQSVSGGSGGSGSAGTAGSSDTSLVMRLVNAAGSPLSGLTVEVHSTPMVTQTNQNGIAIFKNIEGGQHTLYAKDMNGNVIASKSFELLYGAAPILNGDQITVKANTASTLNVQLEGNVLTFLSLQDGDSYQVLPANTGDDSKPWLWFILILASCCFISGIYMKSKRTKGKNRNCSEQTV